MKLSVVDQVSEALKPRNRVAAILGGVLGGAIPALTFAVAHWETASNPYAWLFVAGGLAYSARTVFYWMRRATGTVIGALGFVVLTESVMTFAALSLAGASLILLVAINALATGAQLALDRRDTRKAQRGARAMSAR